ncbi:hypothetical protein MACJ_003237 [Theileria orientalis]|uniref:Uncharacterized protein n=1 Tax=Theileria orientalis TaxID=68886 RepID=A0A976M9W5_THEOR|nr:hypothetical protein MACJ_003237 [Theileria orientalis]
MGFFEVILQIFNSQPLLSLREVVEGHNGSLVVLDWYLPKWVAPECEECGLFKQEEHFDTQDNTPTIISKVSPPNDPHTNQNTGRGYKPEFIKMDTIDSVNIPERSDRTDSDGRMTGDSSVSDVSSSYFLEQDDVNDLDGNFVKTPDLNKSLSDRSAATMHSIDIDDVHRNNTDPLHENAPSVFVSDDKFENSDDDSPGGPNPKIIRGVLVIVGDMNISYRISSTRAGCYCASAKYVDKKNVCESCNENYKKDYEGYNVEHPGFPTLRCLISDALRSGYVCVHLHLNVNMGMASEAFPDSTTLRSFPISLYSDVLIDLDCALNKVTDRFPNCSLVTVGIAFGANILMEYLSLSSQGGTYKVQSGSESEVSTYIAPRDQVPHSATTDTYETTSVRATRFQRSYSQVETNLKQFDNMSEYSHKSMVTDPNRAVALSSASHMQRSAFRNPQTVASNSSIYESIKALDASLKLQNPALTKMSTETLVDDHFLIDFNNEDYYTETKIVYPEPNPHLVFDPEKISAAVCINLNLKLSGNVLYNISKRRFRRCDMYKRFCLSSFKEQLSELLNNIHCRRTNGNIQKDCINFNCCHYNKMVSKFGLIKKFFYHIFFIKNKIKPSVDNYSTEKLIAQLHREYRQSYRDLRKEKREFINYGVMLFDKLGVRSSSDFKVSVLMTLKHKFEREGIDNRVRFRQVTEPPIYKRINKKVNTSLRLGKSVFSRRPSKLGLNVHRIMDYKITKYINSLINSEYTRNLNNIRDNIEYIKVPTLLLYSLDNPMFTLRDIDIFEVIKNPNIVYYISQRGGYSTFLSGIRPSIWFIGPVLEFLDEMSTKSKTF